MKKPTIADVVLWTVWILVFMSAIVVADQNMSTYVSPKHPVETWCRYEWRSASGEWTGRITKPCGTYNVGDEDKDNNGNPFVVTEEGVQIKN